MWSFVISIRSVDLKIHFLILVIKIGSSNMAARLLFVLFNLLSSFYILSVAARRSFLPLSPHRVCKDPHDGTE